MTERVLVTGATGYIGGRLVPRLLEGGHRVRVMARDPARLRGRPWLERVEVAAGDALEPSTLAPALAGVGTAYYLIHSMSGDSSFHQRDLRAARNFGEAARAAGLTRIAYLGGLGHPESDLSEHLRSRQQTGDVLRESGVPVTEFRAAIVVGSGSISFEMIRHLVERLPVMIAPRWVFTQVQPIAIRDVLAYLESALDLPNDGSQIVQIGGQDVLSYGDMMLGYAQERGLSRFIIPVPVLTPRLSSYWVHWVTPIPAQYARPLIEGLRNEVVVRDNSAEEMFPDIQPLDYRQAVRSALDDLQAGRVETAWSDALVSSLGERSPVELEMKEGMIIERRQVSVGAPPASVFRAFTALGGDRGWLYANWAWQLRGLLDRLVGGIGLRRGRRDNERLRQGEALDFWRVEAVETEAMLRLRAEMKLPGEAWLEFQTAPASESNSVLTQIAYFAPKGLVGLLYWYLLYPFHALIFSGLIRSIKQRAERESHAAFSAD